jgi:hypothetical protein
MTSTAYNQAGDYIPRKDSQFMLWGNNLAQLVEADPERYGLTIEDADRIALWAKRFADLYVPSEQPQVRTTTLVRAKNNMRRVVEPIYRQYAQRIKKHPGVTEDDLSGLGIHIDDTGKTRIGAPRSAPLLKVKFSASGGHIIHYSDENSPSPRRKPPGAVLIQIYAAVGPRGLPQRRAVHIGDFGRQPIRIDRSMLPKVPGRVVTYFGRWVTRRGLKGPWSEGKMIPLAGFIDDSADGARRDDAGGPGTAA